MKLWTDAIDRQGYLDARYTCDLDNSSPELRWEDPPQEAAGFVLVVDDPDAPQGTFTHWLVYNIPRDVLHLPAGIPPQDSLPNGIRQGINSYHKLGYAGPCPPRGDRPHHYSFRLYALQSQPEFHGRLTREQLLAAIQPFVLSVAEIQGLYQRAIERAG